MEQVLFHGETTVGVMKFENQTFRDQELDLDGNEFVNCKIENCTLVYRATGKVNLVGNHVSSPKFVFRDSAADTIAFLSTLYQLGLTDLIEGTFNNIRGKSVSGDDDILNSGIIH